MCGLVGYWNPHNSEGLGCIARTMAGAIAHRGPDGAGVWTDPSVGLALGHRRLSVVDLSSAGDQPMLSTNERWVIVFNGEIYNHLDLRRDLKSDGAAPTWRGTSDTETLLASISHYGFERTLQKTVGMFSIALWDRQDRILSLARDRFGEKPLYYGWTGRGAERAFVFGSELKSLRAYEGFDSQICRHALTEYFRYMYVPAPRSIYAGIFKLEPGSLLTIQGTPPTFASGESIWSVEAGGSFRVHRWWSLDGSVSRGILDPIKDEAQAVQELQECLEQSIKLQSLADVPLGAFLSGGVDSSTVVALMQSRASRPIKTFTIGFDVQGFDEAPYAAAVARHLGTEHHETRVTPSMALAVLPTLPHMYDEPFADSSQVPTHLVCRAARDRVTVALSGDAGDELFGGYNRYIWGQRLWQKVSWLPHPLRRALGMGINVVPPVWWSGLGDMAGMARLDEKAYKLAERLKHMRNLDDLYESLVTEWPKGSALVLRGDDAGAAFAGSSGLAGAICRSELPLGLVDPISRMMLRDTLTYLPDDILCKVDRASMACSLETRAPFLDHRVVELAWRLPTHMKIRGNQGKWALRQILYKYVPKELIERPKAGFGIPVGVWLRGPLREWAEAIVSPQRLAAEGYLDPGIVTRVWNEHQSGGRDHTTKLWAVLMFGAWLEYQHNT
jgi:asparagine synthase (glutamine-hydrolysing)